MEKYKLGERVKVKAQKLIGKVIGVHSLMSETGATTYIYEIQAGKKVVAVNACDHKLARMGSK